MFSHTLLSSVSPMVSHIPQPLTYPLPSSILVFVISAVRQLTNTNIYNRLPLVFYRSASRQQPDRQVPPLSTGAWIAQVLLLPRRCRQRFVPVSDMRCCKEKHQRYYKTPENSHRRETVLLSILSLQSCYSP